MSPVPFPSFDEMTPDALPPNCSQLRLLTMDIVEPKKEGLLYLINLPG
jgi:hypothetical protein